jgi:Ca-activated chloride channel family protein
MRQVLVLFIATAAALSSQAAPPAFDTPASAVDQQPVFRSTSSELAVLPVTVTDQRGQLVTDLPRSRFTVYDEGRPQDIAAFTSDDAPVSIALVIDDSGSMTNKIGEVVAATLAFARASHPEDELLVIEFNDAVRDALDGRHVTAADTPELSAALHTLHPSGQTALYDALMDGLGHLDGSTRARRVLVLISDGGDNVSHATLDDVLDRARRSNVTIYSIGLFDEWATDSNPGVLKRLGNASGGERFLPKSPGPLMTACERIAREIRSSYTIGFVPPERDGRFHRLRVELAGGKGLNVRTRPGYVAAPEETR